MLKNSISIQTNMPVIKIKQEESKGKIGILLRTRNK